MKNYINKYCHNIKQRYPILKGYVVSWHEKMLNEGYYKILFFEFMEILVTGFLISLALLTFGLSWKPLLSLSYGLVPWVLIQIAVAAKKEWYKK